eukprot:scaffold4143_cov72-Phaeocystis_antarctica.AAC.1
MGGLPGTPSRICTSRTRKRGNVVADEALVGLGTSQTSITRTVASAAHSVSSRLASTAAARLFMQSSSKKSASTLTFSAVRPAAAATASHTIASATVRGATTSATPPPFCTPQQPCTTGGNSRRRSILALLVRGHSSTPTTTDGNMYAGSAAAAPVSAATRPNGTAAPKPLSPTAAGTAPSAFSALAAAAAASPVSSVCTTSAGLTYATSASACTSTTASSTPVEPPAELELAVGVPANAVARAVDDAAARRVGFGPRIGHEALGSELGPVEVAARHLHAAQPQLAPHADRLQQGCCCCGGGGGRVDDVAGDAGQGLADGGEPFFSPSNELHNACYRHFCRAVGIEELSPSRHVL